MGEIGTFQQWCCLGHGLPAPSEAAAVLAHLGPFQSAQSVQQRLQGPYRKLAFALLQFLFGEDLHENVYIQKNSVQINAVDGIRQQSNHSPETLLKKEKKLGVTEE